MATAKIKLYPFMLLNEKGEVLYTSAYAWEQKDTVENSNGDMRFQIGLPPIELMVSYPDDCREACLQLLKSFEGDQRAGHQALMTQLQFVANGLLGLAAPDILDAEATPVRRSPIGDFPNIDPNSDDDIPL